MFAVVKIAGQQFRVQEGDTLFVPHLSANNGDKIEFKDVLLVSADGTLSVGTDVTKIVKAEVLNNLVQGDKVIAYKQKRRKGFRKKHGHRTQYTQIKIDAIA
ncbi:50S ribosomal protein L21 [Arachidicoccus terrestris]|uniref:50S ribosomal protein L21 n=1 Tax=Arachidicoccus terrestris TaxID=2875539 RepID=UPI001CC4C1AF|nr:50S ribosomal protein L21 [Arachidicoccus terrestris]UAY56679.1 50S ribosomal protein L21 [Arachidicoccus terrestris]